MRISIDYLRRFYADVPRDRRALRELFDDVGLEVKRIDDTDGDTLVTLELLANRGDHHCYHGIARELAGRLEGAVQLPKLASLELGSAPIEVQSDTPLCIAYTLTPIALTDGSGALAAELLPALRAAGITPGLAVVDATNLVNFELGQPTHAFDAAAVQGTIRIRTARAGEKARPLNASAAVELPAGTPVIADDDKILAVAGVIGCEESKVTAATRRVFLESACFDPVAVRMAARALGIQTPASTRFERGADPTLAAIAAARVIELLESGDLGRRAGPTAAVVRWRDPRRRIDLDVRRLSTQLAREVAADEARTRLARYGFEVEPIGEARLRVTVPPHRLWDVSAPEDLYEEIARSVGYNSLRSQLPVVAVGAPPSTEEEERTAVEDVLVGMGAYEVFTDAFYSRPTREALGFSEAHPLWRHVETVNALEANSSLLKNNCLAQAVETVAANVRFKNEHVAAYEWTRTFHPDPQAANKVCVEREVLWLIVNGSVPAPSWRDKGRPADLYYLKGIVRELGVELRQPFVVGPLGATHALATSLHPQRQADVLLHGARVGVLGEVHPDVCRAFGLKFARPCYLELDASALKLGPRRSSVELPPSTLYATRMLAFTLPPRVEAIDVVCALRAAAPAWLDQISICDLFEHEERATPARTVTYALRFSQEGASRTSDELNATTFHLADAVIAELGARGVKLREGGTASA